ncbi:SLATT domain-containing protein [Enterobacter hormaechei subsp. steigerwaltii]|uniref:SLATT domain-containing protein n=1 Tax=Enterobacter hormaechei TaxID=158836 RepID=UPI0023F93CB3|nr:SLATT domain-containing protein [Enterobacter hormaechei]MDF7702822.1 SLATT domain-containing protein [Enterobacter hormaechei subsp. steigerwaltii]MDF7727136.1 SLATT domain-containing protein [Enterobacter hormaechei subsp. steigerwaltii]
MRDNIWFTYKARINAHHRLEWLEKHSQFILVWYAILSAILSIVTIRFPTVLGNNTDILAAILSVALLGISLVVSNLDFRGRAIAMRRNYLAMQRIYFASTDDKNLTSEQRNQYHELLDEVENHLDIDDKAARVSQADLETRIPTAKEIREVKNWKIKRFIFTYVFYLLPILLVWMDYDC